MKKRPDLLDSIINKARHEHQRGQRLKAIFDLDSTLFDVSPRIAQILRAFAAEPEMQKLFPKECVLLSKTEPQSSDYGVKKTLQRIGVKSASEEFVKNIVPYWKKHFFGSDYLKYDVPYPGAREYVRDLFEAGADILYLTGRDVPRMMRGTIESLKQWNFPVNEGHANLILKPSTSETDSAFKKDFFLKMERSSPEVWFFENEPTNIELVLSSSPHIKIVFVETVHSDKTPPPGAHVPKISGYIL